MSDTNASAPRWWAWALRGWALGTLIGGIIALVVAIASSSFLLGAVGITSIALGALVRQGGRRVRA